MVILLVTFNVFALLWRIVNTDNPVAHTQLKCLYIFFFIFYIRNVIWNMRWAIMTYHAYIYIAKALDGWSHYCCLDSYCYIYIEYPMSLWRCVYIFPKKPNYPDWSSWVEAANLVDDTLAGAFINWDKSFLTPAKIVNVTGVNIEPQGMNM